MKLEVIGPIVSSRVEEAHDPTAHGVHAREVGALVEIAPVARESKVIQVVIPAVLAGNYVLNVMLLIDMLLTEQAVLAAVIRAAADGAPPGGVHRYPLALS